MHAEEAILILRCGIFCRTN